MGPIKPFYLYSLLDMLMCCRNDVLPCRAYLRHCILASKNLGQEAYDSFMDHTFLVQCLLCCKMQTADGEQHDMPQMQASAMWASM